MIISMIAAVSQNDVIGKNGKLPWHVASDMKRFRELTMGQVVIMGRKTWDSIPGRPLKGRCNIVISRNKEFYIPNDECHVARSFEDAISKARLCGHEYVMVIGGGEIYKTALPFATYIHLTRVGIFTLDGDAHFPVLFPDQWEEECERSRVDEQSQLWYQFCTLSRIPFT